MNLYWKRAGYVEITDENGTHRYGGSDDSLDFRFSGTKIGDVCPRFKVSILGLSLKTIAGLTVYNPSEAMTRKIQVKVFAGYGDDAPSKEIFNGIVFEAIPTSPPEMWLNMECIYNPERMDSVSDEDIYALTNQTQKRIFQNVCYICGLDGTIDSNIDNGNFDGDKRFSFEISGPKKLLPKKFADAFGYKAIVDRDSFLLTNKEPWNDPSKNAVGIDLNTGMIEIPKVSIAGATIKMRLNDSFSVGSWVRLTSTMIPKANEDYFVVRKTHTGHFRGDEWFTELECYRHGYRQ